VQEAQTSPAAQASSPGQQPRPPAQATIRQKKKWVFFFFGLFFVLLSLVSWFVSLCL
jgi:hypothetical protein